MEQNPAWITREGYLVNDPTEDPVDVIVYNLEKAYDKLWLDDSTNDLIDTIGEDNSNEKIVLMNKSNEETRVSVKTPFGPTTRETFKSIAQQGGSWGGVLCTNSVDRTEKKSNKISKYTNYIYRKILEVPLLSYIDDLNKVTKCGVNSLENNTIVTKQIETKRLNFNVGNDTKKSKCEKLHIGKDKSKCTTLTVRNRSIE